MKATLGGVHSLGLLAWYTLGQNRFQGARQRTWEMVFGIKCFYTEIVRAERESGHGTNRICYCHHGFITVPPVYLAFTSPYYFSLIFSLFSVGDSLVFSQVFLSLYVKEGKNTQSNMHPLLVFWHCFTKKKS